MIVLESVPCTFILGLETRNYVVDSLSEIVLTETHTPHLLNKSVNVTEDT